jgi:hypothetical protein
VASPPQLRIGGFVGLHGRHLAKLQVLNHLTAAAAEAANDVATSELVDFLLHAPPPQGATELSADNVLRDSDHRVRRGPGLVADGGWTSVNPTVEMCLRS